MSKKETKSKQGKQVKPKLKIKVNINDQEVIYDEYMLAAMISDLITRVNNLELHTKSILDAMEEASKVVPKNELKLPDFNNLKLS